ncbi:MAG TPA: glycosyltransferase family 87 protein [Reyranella sp.]|nr:glycosyltransferase family 87 protein [Reyranella sp.]
MIAERRDILVAAIFCGAVGLYDALYLWNLFTDGPLIGPAVVTPFPDFLVFQAAARAWVEGKASLIYDIDALTAFQNAIFADRLPGEVRFRPFFYPPIWLLLLLPVAALTVGYAYTLFLSITVAFATLLEGRRDGWGWLAVLVSPAATWVAITGQNTFFSLALFYGGMHLLGRSPALAGILLGLLAYKPQLWALVPLALVAARQWRALASTLGTVLATSLASLAVFGPDLWRAFFAAAREASSARVVDEMLARVSSQMTSLFDAGYILGLSTGAASTLQMGGALLAVVAVWLGFRRYPPSPARTALLATATFLVSPYTLNYDLLLLMPAAVGLFRLGAVQGFYPGERLLHAALWLMPLAGMILNRLGLPLAPLIILLFGVVAWRRLAPKVELPGAAGAR